MRIEHAVRSGRGGPLSLPDAQPRPSYWAFGPAKDLTFVLLTPLAILLAFTAAGRGGWTDGLIAFVLALAMAHYLPGMLRAYGDRALFRRFRIRLLVAPVFILSITIGCALAGFNFVFLIAAAWGAWHWMMQMYGFARIYDAKAAVPARSPAWLDRMMCLLWFGAAIFVVNDVLPVYMAKFYESGGPLIPEFVLSAFRQAWLAATLGLTVYYAIEIGRGLRAHRRPNPLKFAFIALTFLYLSYTASLIDAPVTAYAMFEAWHDIQYLAIVWLFNLNRSRNNPEAGPFIRFLFRPRPLLAVAYVLLCLAFGSLTHAWSLFDDPLAARVAVAFVLSMALLHYYLDGFIWKIRESETRQALGMGGAAPERPERAVGRPAWVRQLGLWLLFAGPAAAFLLMESAGSAARPLEVRWNLAQSFPASADIQYALGRELLDQGRAGDARRPLERAIELEPDLAPARVALGVLLVQAGRPSEAQEHFERALMLDPDSAETHNNLGITFEEQGVLDRARLHFERAVTINPEYAVAHNNLGRVFAALGDLARARAHHETAVRIDPEFTDAHYLLALTLAGLGDADGAVRHFEATLRIDPGQYQAHNNLGAVLAGQQKLDAAIAHFEQAVRINPAYASAQQNLAVARAERDTR